jgi:hypothetical protein
LAPSTVRLDEEPLEPSGAEPQAVANATIAALKAVIPIKARPLLSIPIIVHLPRVKAMKGEWADALRSVSKSSPKEIRSLNA